MLSKFFGSITIFTFIIFSLDTYGMMLDVSSAYGLDSADPRTIIERATANAAEIRKIVGSDNILRRPAAYQQQYEHRGRMIVGSGYSYIGLNHFGQREHNPYYTIDQNRLSHSSGLDYPLAYPDFAADISAPLQPKLKVFADQFVVVALERLPISVNFGEGSRTVANCLEFLRTGGILVMNAPPCTIIECTEERVKPEEHLAAPFIIQLKRTGPARTLRVTGSGAVCAGQDELDLCKRGLNFFLESYLGPKFEALGLNNQIESCHLITVGPRTTHARWLKRSDTTHQFLFEITKK